MNNALKAGFIAVLPVAASVAAWECIAACCTAICTYKTKNVFVSMFIGVVIVAAARQFGL